MNKNQKIMEQLKKLNNEKPVSKDLMDYYKKTNEKMKKVLDSIKNNEKQIPDIAKETGLDPKDVLWCLTGLIKYSKAEVIMTKTGYMKYKAK